MTKSDLQKLIRNEVTAVVKSELQRMVKPLVQEAVAGALAGLLAEGIVKGVPTPTKARVLAPNVPQARAQTAPGTRPAASGRALDSSTRQRLARQMGYGNIESVGTHMGEGVVGDILAETAMEMAGHSGPMVDSVLDNADDIGAVAPEVVDAITRDYSGLMAAMNRRGKING